MTVDTRPETLPAEPTLEPRTPIKPSEALRLGRLIRPLDNPRGEWFGRDGSACALGAITIGWGGAPGFGESHIDYMTLNQLERYGIDPFDDIADRYDENVFDGRGDAAVLAYLESRGL